MMSNSSSGWRAEQSWACLPRVVDCQPVSVGPVTDTLLGCSCTFRSYAKAANESYFKSGGGGSYPRLLSINILSPFTILTISTHYLLTFL